MAMQFTRETANEFSITAFGETGVRVGDVTFTESILVSHNVSARRWANAMSLSAEALAEGVRLNAEIVIIGTGKQHRFPKPEALRALIDARVGFEVMSSAAACRTYNVLLSEGRKVGLMLCLDR